MQAKLKPLDSEEALNNLQAATSDNVNLAPSATSENPAINEDDNKTFKIVSADGVRYSNITKYLNNTVENHLDESVGAIKNWLYK